MTQPAWRRRTRGEHRWPALLAVIVAIALQLGLPDQVTPAPRWLLPGLEALLIVVLLVSNPLRIDRTSQRLRAVGIGLASLVGLATALSVAGLVVGLVDGRFGDDAAPLLATGGAIWLTNVIAFALLYWEFDRGGPADRAAGVAEHPDFLFAQMQTPEVADPDWEPVFVDYLYVSFTNSTAFSPTDTLPLSRWAKGAMLVQALVSLVTVALVVARAVNVLGWSAPTVATVSDLISIDDIAAAADRIAGHVVRTPTVDSPGLAAHLGVPVALKLELLQRTGSFKPRGAFHKLLGLSLVERAAGVVAVSGGNHGLADADTAGALGIAATIVMPSSVPERAVSTCRASGADVRLTDDMAGAFALLDELVAAGMTLVHPFDDRDVIAAQGTVGAEFAADAPGLTDVLVSIGGGALISGVAAAFPGVRVWGVETEGADAMTRALAAGSPVSFTPTSVVSTLSAPYVTPLTLDHVRALVEDVLVVSDADAVRGTLTLAERAKVWAEPAAGCLVPAALRVLDRVGPDARLGLVICGGNATTADLAGWTGRFAATPFPPRPDPHPARAHSA